MHFFESSILAITIACMTAGSARSDYVADFFSTTTSNDFTYASIAQHGETGDGIHNYTDCAEGYARLSSRYYQPVSRFLITSDGGSGLDNGYYSESVAVELQFDYFNGNSSNAFAELAVSANGLAAYNNYPIYYARVALNTLSIYRHEGYDEVQIVASDVFDEISGTGLMLKFSALHADGDDVGLVASLFQNDSLVRSISYVDPFGFKGGYVGFAGGDAYNSAEIRGIDITGFSVSSPIPEPAAISFICLFGIVALAIKRIYIKACP